MAESGNQNTVAKRWLCGVPEVDCTGQRTAVSNSLRKNHKTHSSSKEAFNCYVHFLKETGYIRLGSREFQRGSEPILVLPKKTKFGSMLRTGKAGRTQPKRPGGTVV